MVFTLLSFLLYATSVIKPALAQSFTLNFESARFKDPASQGPITDPVIGFDLSAFRLFEGDDIQGNSINIDDVKFSLLKQCSPTHYIARIAPGTQDRIGGQSIIKIANDDTGKPLFRSFDLTELCLGCAFIPAATQGVPVGSDVTNRDVLTRFVVPASCKIKLTGRRVGEGQNEFSEIFTYTARAPLDLGDPRKLFASEMKRQVLVASRWSRLQYVKVEIEGRPEIGLPADLPNIFGDLTGALAPFYSVALDNIKGTKRAN